VSGSGMGMLPGGEAPWRAPATLSRAVHKDPVPLPEHSTGIGVCAGAPNSPAAVVL
jgi:hypothetical protein